MSLAADRHCLQLRSLLSADGALELSLQRVAVPAPKAHEVVIRIEAAPINPSDLGLLLAGADLAQAEQRGTPEAPVIAAKVPEAMLRSLRARVAVSMPVGNEGAGGVVEAGDSEAGRALLGKTVAALGGAMYSEYRCVGVEQCLALPSDVTAAQGAAAFVNPLTALCMVETMRREGHTALVHTAAASNLGKMLNRICQKEGVALVNIVRGEEQAAALRALGAKHVCLSTALTFTADLIAALSETGATLAFDAIGGGKLAGHILMCMEAAINQKATHYSRYGSSVHKQVYVYGGLGLGPLELSRNFGMAWGVGGWLVTPFLQKIGPDATAQLKARIAAEIKTTFASTYAGELSLADALDLKRMAEYAKAATGHKYLINPQKKAGGSP